jgi:hypothetical protein
MQREAGLSLVLCSFFTWTNTEFQMEDPMPRVPVPCFQKVKIERFAQEEVSRILKDSHTREAQTRQLLPRSAIFLT